MEFMETTQSDATSLDAEMRCIACGRKVGEYIYMHICIGFIFRYHTQSIEHKIKFP